MRRLTINIILFTFNQVSYQKKKKRIQSETITIIQYNELFHSDQSKAEV